jgi:hypothetical protein
MWAALGDQASTMSNTSVSTSANTMNYTELTARTQFILDRAAFLKDVWRALIDEGKPEADEKIKVWIDYAYVPLIARCILDRDEHTRNEAMWAVANMLGADTPAVVEATKAALTPELLKSVLDYVFTESNETVRCAAFLLNNYARFGNMSYSDAQSLVYTTCVKGITATGKTATGLLWAANYAAAKFPAAIPLSIVINALGDMSINKEKAQHLRRLLGCAAENDGLIHANLLEPVVTVLDRLLSEAISPDIRTEILWILANVMTEIGAPEVFFGHQDLLVDIVSTVNNTDQESLEAAFALTNFVKLVRDPAIQEYLARGVRKMSVEDVDDYSYDIYDAFYYQLLSDTYPLSRKLGKEGLEALNKYAEIYFPSVNEENDREVKVESNGDINVTVPSVVVAVPLSHETEAPVPCAFELLYGGDRGSCNSDTVRRLVSLVEQALLDSTGVGDDWAKVPLDTELTVGDLVTLQHMGYVFDGEWLGVNPTIYSGY